MLSTLVVPHESGPIILNPTEYLYVDSVTYLLYIKISDTESNTIIGSLTAV